MKRIVSCNPLNLSTALGRAVVVAALLVAAAPPVLAQAPAPLSPAASGAAREVDLQLAPFVRQIRAANKAILSKRTEQEIAGTGIERAGAAFQPQASVSVLNGRQRLKNTPEEDLVRQGLGLYDRTGTDYSVGVSQLLDTGAKLEAKATMSKFLTNITRNIRQNDNEDYKTFYGLTLTQPLARDAGREVTYARVRVAELDTKAAQFASGDTEASVVAEAIFSYWDLLLAQERAASAIEKVRMGERLLQEARALNRQGRLPQSEIWEVENISA